MPDADVSPCCSRLAATLLMLSALALVAIALFSTAAVADEGPYLNVTSPPVELFTNNDTVLVAGVTEPGINVSVHNEGDGGQAWTNGTAEANGTFHIPVDLFLGHQNLTVVAENASGNRSVLTRHVVRDITPPRLTVRFEYLNGTAVPWNEVGEGYFVNVAEVVLNGTFTDDFGTDGTYGVNGVWRYIFPGVWRPGSILERVTLGEGINTFIVEVDDRAGNRAMERLYINLDSFPPPLFVYAPLDFERTRNATASVAGLTEPNVRVDVVVQASAGTRAYDLMSRMDGTFQVDVRLFEGIQKVIITATDWIGNQNTTDLDVVLDTTPPEIEILKPEENPYYTNQTSVRIIGQNICECTSRIFIANTEVPNTGVFESTVSLVEGENHIIVRSVDKVGNEFVVELLIYLDTLPPQLTVTEPSGDPIVTNNPTIHLEGSVTGATGVTVSIKDREYDAVQTSGTLLDGDWEYDLELLEGDREQDVVVTAVDRVGNRVNWSVHVVLDLEPPRVIQGSGDLGYTNSGNYLLRGNVSADAVSVNVNDVPANLFAGCFSILLVLEEGENPLAIEVTDRAGNRASDHAFIVLDTVPPKCKFDYPSTTSGGKATIKGNWPDDVTWVMVNDMEVTPEDGRFQVPVELPEEGKNVFIVTYGDRAGNTATKTVTITRVEDTPGAGPVAAVAALTAALVAMSVALAIASRGRRGRT